MTNGIVIHIQADTERRTEFFNSERIRIGADINCDLQFIAPLDLPEPDEKVWLELKRDDGFYRVAKMRRDLDLRLNGQPLQQMLPIHDGDYIEIAIADVKLSFFAVRTNAALLTRDSHTVRFIEEAAIESATSPAREDAKIFLREFLRELVQEISITTKLVTLGIVVASLAGVFYLGYALYHELERGHQQAEAQSQAIKNLETQLSQTTNTIGKIDESNKEMMKTVSLAPTLRVEYGNGVCLLVGTYDLVDRNNGKILRYPDPNAVSASPDYLTQSPNITEDGFDPPPPNTQTTQNAPKPQPPLTTEGNGSPVEYDFVGTGFHVGNGYIVTNRHVVQPWTVDEKVKLLNQLSNGRARLKRLVVYFPAFSEPFPIKVRQVDTREDLAITTIDPNSVFPEIPVLPLDIGSDAATVGKTVITMGYPNGPDRILAMVDDSEARSINARYGSSLQTLVNHLAQSKRIQPLLTQGAITDLDARRIVHDARTAEGGSGAPLFGQTGKVIGVNFGVFADNTAANMAIPIRYVVTILQRNGWKSPEQQLTE
ncbi:MAG: trypsin-like peptidase domain-containing protein, partial [Pyrinomonadaceae bacterium]|nr:trypsin-like peptidase domain-containing protein [Pyrinomonadaceae bacterium]